MSEQVATEAVPVSADAYESECPFDTHEVSIWELFWPPAVGRAKDHRSIRDLVTDITFYMNNGYRVQLAWTLPSRNDQDCCLYSCSILDASQRLNTIVVTIDRAKLVRLAKASVLYNITTLDRFLHVVMPAANEIGILDQYDQILPFLRAQLIGFDLIHSQRPAAFDQMGDGYRRDIALALPIVMAQRDTQDMLEIVRGDGMEHGTPFPPRWYEHWCFDRSQPVFLTVRASLRPEGSIFGTWTYSDD